MIGGGAASALRLSLRLERLVEHGDVEADSLNASILGPDVADDDPEFELFVKGVVTEMMVKAGQKCTAIRRTTSSRSGRSAR